MSWVARKKKIGRVGVLMGGASTEREISLKSGTAVFEALKERLPDVVAIDIQTENPKDNAALIKSQGIECAFIALHGRFGEDGQIQGILEELRIPYTGSGVNASRLAMDKIASRKIFQVHRLQVPKYKVLERSTHNSNRRVHKTIALPLVIKPATHGSSIGLSIVDYADDVEKAIGTAFSFDERVLVEEYIMGREVTVGILKDRPLPVIEIVPKKRFFDYEAKYQAGMTDYIVPAAIDDAMARAVQRAALQAHTLLGCDGCSRVDLIIRSDNTPFILEVNTIPGFTATSLLPKAARLVGIDFAELCVRLIELAYEKT